jgi:hypothetical protein
MTHGQQCHIASLAVELRSVTHDDMEGSGQLVLEMRGFATLGLCKGFYRSRPLPSRLKCRPADHGPSDIDELHFPLGKCPDLIRSSEALQLGFFLFAFHVNLLLFPGSPVIEP